MNLPILTESQERMALIGVGALGGGAVVFGEGTTRTLGAAALVVALFLAWKAGMLGFDPGLHPGPGGQGDDGDDDYELPSLETWINVIETAPDGTQTPGSMRLRNAGPQFLAGGTNGYTIEPADAAAHAALSAYVIAANNGTLALA